MSGVVAYDTHKHYRRDWHAVVIICVRRPSQCRNENGHRGTEAPRIFLPRCARCLGGFQTLDAQLKWGFGLIQHVFLTPLRHQVIEVLDEDVAPTEQRVDLERHQVLTHGLADALLREAAHACQ